MVINFFIPLCAVARLHICLWCRTGRPQLYCNPNLLETFKYRSTLGKFVGMQCPVLEPDLFTLSLSAGNQGKHELRSGQG